MKSVIWKTEEGRKRLDHWYLRFQSKISTESKSEIVPTRFGESHVLVAGNEDAPPLVCLHAMRTGAAFALAELNPLLSRFRVIAPDIPGQSVRGLDARLSLKDDSLANWLLDILDFFSLDSVALLGVSWGGFVARLTANKASHRIRKLALVVPAGIANGSHLTGLAKMLIPMIKYRIKPSEANLRNLLNPIVTTWDEDWAGAIACSIQDLKVDSRIPPLATDQELQQLESPTLVLAGDQDISFPGHAVKERVSRLIPNVDAEILQNCKHCPPTTDEFRDWLGERLIRFLEAP